jgi:hypothetical protein
VDKFDPNPVRDPVARFGVKDHADASAKADEKAKAAKLTGSKEDHKEAGIAHEHASTLHADAAVAARAAGDATKAQSHEVQALAHDATSKFHHREAEKAGKGDCMDSSVVKQKVMKMLYPPLGNQTDVPKAQTFAEIYAGLEQMEEFKELGDEFQEKINALCQSAWSILSDASVKDKQKSINASVDAFVASVKQGLTEADEKAAKVDADLRKICKADDAWDDKDALCKAIIGVGKDGKTQDGVEYPKGDFAYTPDEVPSHWKLRLTSTPGGKPDAGIVGAAVAALGKGFRGKKVQIPAEAMAGVKAKVRAAWKLANPDKGADELPPVLKSDKGETTMSLEEIQKRQDAQEAELAVLKAANTALVAENETVLNMSKKERKLYAGMDDAKRKEFLAGDAKKRKEMLAEAAAAEAGDPVEPDADDEAEKEEKKVVAKRMAESDARVAKAEARVTKTEEELASLRKHDRLIRFTKMAEDALPHTPGKPEDKGERLMKLAEAFGGEDSEMFKAEFEEKKAADRALALQFREVGKSGGVVPVEKMLDAKVAEIQKRDNIDEPHAMAKAAQEAPELFMDYDRQKRQLVHQQ